MGLLGVTFADSPTSESFHLWNGLSVAKWPWRCRTMNVSYWLILHCMFPCGDIDPQLPGPFQRAKGDSKKIATGDIKRSTNHARKNRKHLMSVAHLNVRSVASRENMCLLKQTVTNNYLYIFTVSGSWLDPTVYDADILFRHIRLSGEIEGHTGEAVDYSSVISHESLCASYVTMTPGFFW